jgi:hypothetical protein
VVKTHADAICTGPRSSKKRKKRKKIREEKETSKMSLIPASPPL